MFRNAEDAEKLWQEIRAAEVVRDQRLATRKERIRRLAGPYADSHAASDYEPENRLWEYIGYVLPRAAFDNPRVRIRSRRTGIGDVIAKALQSGANRMIVDLELRRTLRQNCLDYLLDFGPCLIAPEPMPGLREGNDPVWWPQLYTLDPHTYFQDPLALRPDQCRFQGHVYLRDKDTLIESAKEEDGWDLAAVRELTEEAGVEKVHGDRQDVPPRGEVALYEVFVPELHDSLDADPDDGYSGTLYTLGVSRTRDGDAPYHLRKPRPFYGPRWGPYRVASFMYVQDIALGLSPTIPAEAQLRDLAATSRAMLENAKAHKTMTTLPANDPVAHNAANAPGRYTIPLKPGAAELIKQIEIGGVTQQQILHYQLKTATLDRVLGMHDIQRGLVSGEGTASEVLTAQAASDVRVSDIVQVYHDHVADVLRTMIWYSYHDDRFTVSLEGMEIPGFVAPKLRGGKTEGLTFDELELEIEPFSMEHESAAMRQQRVQATMETVGWLAQAVPQAPWLPWNDIIPELVEDTRLGESLGNIDVAAAVEWAAQMAQFQGKQQPDVSAQSGRQSQGRPINVRMQAPGGKSPPAQIPQRTASGGQMAPGKGKAK